MSRRRTASRRLQISSFESCGKRRAALPARTRGLAAAYTKHVGRTQPRPLTADARRRELHLSCVRTAESIKGYIALLSAEYRSAATAEQYVHWAQDALEQGLDSPALLRLAIEDPPFFTPDLKRLFGAAVAELEIERITGEQALIAHAQELAVKLLNHDLSPRDAGRQIARIFDLDVAPSGFTHWYLIDEAEYCEYCAASFAGDKPLESAIVEEATKLLAYNWRKRSS